MEQRLSLSLPAGEIPSFAISHDLRDVALHGEPSADLAIVFPRHPSTSVVSAVPLEPAARIRGVNPTFLAPNGEGLARVDSEEIE